MIFEFSNDILVEQQFGDGRVWIAEIFVEGALFDKIPNHQFINSNIKQSLSHILVRPSLTITTLLLLRVVHLRCLVVLVIAITHLLLTCLLASLPVAHIAVIVSILVNTQAVLLVFNEFSVVNVVFRFPL